MPSLQDPNFARSVVVLAAHSDEGAFGLIINHALEVAMSAICAEADIPWSGDDTLPVFGGGPVERQRGWLLHPSALTFDATQPIVEGLSVTTSQDGLAAYGAEPGGRFRLVLGYAGWGPGQLEREIAEGSWLTGPISAGLVFDTPPDAQWRAAMALVGVDPDHLVDAGTQIN